METLESIRRKIDSVHQLEAVVHTMKAMAAASINQYEMAVKALSDYYRTVALGIAECVRQERINPAEVTTKTSKQPYTCAIVFGSEQGLIGQFNQSLTDFAASKLNGWSGDKEIWTVGERAQMHLLEAGLPTAKLYAVPGSVRAITPLVGQILMNIEENEERGRTTAYYIFHNRPTEGAGYESVSQRLLPFDRQWKSSFEEIRWPTKKLPQMTGGLVTTLPALIREYLFISIYKSCAESLASENAARLGAMRRAEKNIEDLSEQLKSSFNRLRQSTIDEELFDVVSGFEAFRKKD